MSDALEARLREENRRIEQLRCWMDLTAQRLREDAVSWEEGRRLIEEARRRALELFPENPPEAEELFDLIYKPRFHRILDEKLYMM